MITNTEEIRNRFAAEFGILATKFVVFDLHLNQASDYPDARVCPPGVYVFFHPSNGVVKVGRHFLNSRKRALEHVQDNTGGSMKALAGDPGVRLLLFNVNHAKDAHWVAALEDFFEQSLSPSIRSLRRC